MFKNSDHRNWRIDVYVNNKFDHYISYSGNDLRGCGTNYLTKLSGHNCKEDMLDKICDNKWSCVGVDAALQHIRVKARQNRSGELTLVCTVSNSLFWDDVVRKVVMVIKKR